MEISVNNVVKSYKDVRAVDHVSFEVKKGEVYGIIGPNGAGKTTLMEIMLGLRRQDSGEVKIQDYDNIVVRQIKCLWISQINQGGFSTMRALSAI